MPLLLHAAGSFQKQCPRHASAGKPCPADAHTHALHLPLPPPCSAPAVLNRTSPGSNGQLCALLPSSAHPNFGCRADSTCFPLPENVSVAWRERGSGSVGWGGGAAGPVCNICMRHWRWAVGAGKTKKVWHDLCPEPCLWHTTRIDGRTCCCHCLCRRCCCSGAV